MKGFCAVKKAPKRAFDPRSFRWKRVGRTRMLIGCPKGKWNASAQTCRVGTRAYEVLKPGRCP